MNRKAFTILQVVVALFVASSLTTLALPALRKLQDQTKRVLVNVDKEQLGVALEFYYRDHGTYPVGDNADMVKAINGRYIDFEEKTLRLDILGRPEFMDPWKRPYDYYFATGDKDYRLRFLGMPVHKNLFDYLNRKDPQTQREEFDTKQIPILDNKTVVVEETFPPIKTPVETPSTPKVPLADPVSEGVLPMEVVANDGMLFVTIYNIFSRLDSVSIDRKESLGGLYEDLFLAHLEDDGNVRWNEGDPIFYLFDFNVKNGIPYSYQGIFQDSLNSDMLIRSLEKTGTPLSTANQDIREARALLNDESLNIKGIYELTAQDIFNSLRDRGIAIYWGYNSPLLNEDGSVRETTLGYIETYFDSQTGELKEFIVVNTDELKGKSIEVIASLLIHEGLHHFWSHVPPDLPDGIEDSRTPNEEEPRGNVGRSQNSIDEEFSAFVLSLKLWEATRGNQVNSINDQLLNIYNGANGKKELRDYVRLLYDLPEY